MKKVVLDSSVIVKWFSKEEDANKAKNWLKYLEERKVEIFLPELAKYEIANAILKGKGLPYSQAKNVLEIFYSLPLNFVGENFELAKISYQLAEKLNITYYDACFLSLAKKYKISLITANPRHQKKVRGLEVISL